ncbi:MAG: J domain-containing protein [Anaerolineales bacterium]
MRLDSNYVRLHVVSELAQAPFATIRYDDFDVVVVDLPDAQAAAVCLMERAIPLQEIISIYRDHEKAGIHTVFLLWCEMLLPNPNTIFEVPDWLRALHALSGNCVYTYKTVGDEVDIFSVYFKPLGYGPEHIVQYGPSIDVKDLGCAWVDISGETLSGRWPMVDFVAGRGAQHIYRARMAHETYQHVPPPPETPAELLAHYMTLGLAPSTNWETIKQAYRRLARQYHPDLNPGHSATARMQAINAAYAMLLQYHESERKR